MSYTIKIYKIVNDFDDQIYIGSTAGLLRKRLFSTHLMNYKHHSSNPSTKYPNYKTSFILFEKHGVENCSIILLEEFQVNNREQQLKHEREYYDKLKPFLVNAQKPIRTRSETLQYYKDHKKQNPEMMARQKINRIIASKTKYRCPVCCKQMPRGCKVQHEHGLRHQKICQLFLRVDVIIKQFKHSIF